MLWWNDTFIRIPWENSHLFLQVWFQNKRARSRRRDQHLRERDHNQPVQPLGPLPCIPHFQNLLPNLPVDPIPTASHGPLSYSMNLHYQHPFMRNELLPHLDSKQLMPLEFSRSSHGFHPHALHQLALFQSQRLSMFPNGQLQRNVPAMHPSPLATLCRPLHNWYTTSTINCYVRFSVPYFSW